MNTAIVVLMIIAIVVGIVADHVDRNTPRKDL
jgi:hypothetical protein